MYSMQQVTIVVEESGYTKQHQRNKTIKVQIQ